MACINESLKTNMAGSQPSRNYRIDLGNLNQNSNTCACNVNVCVCVYVYVKVDTLVLNCVLKC